MCIVGYTKCFSWAFVNHKTLLLEDYNFNVSTAWLLAKVLLRKVILVRNNLEHI